MSAIGNIPIMLQTFPRKRKAPEPAKGSTTAKRAIKRIAPKKRP